MDSIKINLSGATRIVFIFKKFVIKIPNVREYKLFLYGILSNLQEKTFSKMKREDLAHVYFCSPFGLFLIMQRAEVTSDMNERRFIRMIYKKYKDDDLRCFMIADCKPDNWGYINGNLVKVDYGD